MKKWISYLLIVLCPMVSLGTVTTEASGTLTPLQDVERDNDERMGWWRESKFGLFVHWGVYAVLAGEYRGEPVPGIGEWIQYRKKIPHQQSPDR